MNLKEYGKMAAVAESHWWYAGLRDLIATTLSMERFAMPPDAVILDAGCGTGETLRVLGERFSAARVLGFDMSEAAIDFAKRKAPGARVYLSDIRRPQVPVDRLDVVISCDVISVPGMAATFEGLATLVSHLRPGGLLILNLPAFEWMRSEHDVAYWNRERYTARQVRAFLERLGLSAELVTYRLFFLFPAVLLARLPSILGPRRKVDHAETDSDLPAAAVNTTLRAVQKLESVAIDSGIRFPWGTSVYAVGRKPTA